MAVTEQRDSDLIPIRAACIPSISNQERRSIRQIADKLLENEPALNNIGHFGSDVTCGLEPSARTIFVSDQSEIALFGAPEEGLLEYRLAVLACPHDMLVLSHDRSRGFENYLADYLDITDLDVLMATSQAANRHWPLAKRCVCDAELFRRVVRFAANTSCLNIVSYLSTGHIWDLARRLSQAAGVKIRVAAPPPRLSKRINDKIWFANRVKQVLGSLAVSPAAVVFGPAALAGHVKRLASGADRLVIKVPDSAGSSGNLCLEASAFRGDGTQRIADQLRELLGGIGWQGRFPLKLEVWEAPVLASPSAQIWIPNPRDGLPVIEGIYEQTIEGERSRFAGAKKSRMPTAMRTLMENQALQLACLFQHLGYFGRCSMDALVIGADHENANLHWVECNGRWGGVSIPMTTANRFLPNPDEYEQVIVQRVGLGMPRRSFQEAVELTEGLLFVRAKPGPGIVFLSPTSFERGVGVHFLALAETLDRAKALSDQALSRLVGS
jgi:hypothetical protein